MKEITRIHLARTPFNVEIDAKKALEKYLDAIQASLGNDDDTMREIEARIIEILAERHVEDEQVITVDDIEAVKARLGAPSDFMNEDDHAEDLKSQVAEKRLMRDTERGLLGGVCAGIAGYFGVNVMWPRLLAVLLVFVSFGAAALVYAVLWLVIPAAKTAAEKLQMRGEPVTLAALKSEASEKNIEVPERSKPLVILLRIVLGAGFSLLAAGAIALIGLAVFVREPIFAISLDGVLSNGVLSLLGGAYIAMIAAGLLFVTLMTIAAYASFAWVINKKLLTSGIVIIVLGLSSFVTAMGLGINGADQARQQIEQQRTTETLSDVQIRSSLDHLVIASDEVPVEYRATSGAAHVDVEYMRDHKKPVVTLEDSILTVKSGEDCTGITHGVCYGIQRVIVYGPSLKSIDLRDGSLSYYPADQKDLSVELKGGVDLNIKGGINKLALKTPQLCGDEKAYVDFASVNSLTINGAPSDTAQGSTSCLELN